MWEGGEEPVVIHGVLTWARAGRWRMRQAEPGRTGIEWAESIVPISLARGGEVPLSISLGLGGDCGRHSTQMDRVTSLSLKE